MSAVLQPRVSPGAAASRSPFDLDDDDAYRRWRDAKLERQPRRVEELVVDVADPRQLTVPERAALFERCARANMAIYRSPLTVADKSIPRRLGQQLGLHRLDANWLADEDGISPIMVSTAKRDAPAGNGDRAAYIPYTDRPIRWHTDGYYHPPARRIEAMLLHCVARPAQTGPVFSLTQGGQVLHMRYTARTRSIEWKADTATRTAVAFLERLLAGDGPALFRIRLDAGMGLVCNNVLHDRSGFADDPQRPRLLYRARYLDRIG